MNNEYELDNMVNEFIVNAVGFNKYTAIKQTFFNVNKMNNLYLQDTTLDLEDNLESTLKDMINSTEDSTDDVILQMDIFIKNQLVNHLYKLGILVENNINYEILDIT